MNRPLLVLVLAAGAWISVRAEFFAGMAAFERGDFATALSEWESLAEQGDMQSQYYVGRIYHEDPAVRDDAAAARWYRAAADQGHAEAQNDLGVLYEQGRGLQRDEVQAALWYRKAAEQGLRVAQANLAELLDRGRGGAVTPDAAEAARWYRRAAEQGHATAQYRLGVFYETGRGVAADPEKAARWYRRAARQDHAGAQQALASLYEQGRGVKRDPERAARWQRRAVAQGIAPTVAAQPSGEPQEARQPATQPQDREPEREETEGPAPPPAVAEAEEEDALRQQAAHGEAEAQYLLGRRYATGDGVPQSPLEAGKWFLAAAEQGHPLAGYRLAFQYLRGQGVARTKDLVLAHFWLTVAAEQGVGDAVEWREKVARKLTRAEREESARRLDAWRSSRP